MVKSNNYSKYLILLIITTYFLTACGGKAWDIDVAKGTLEKEGFQVDKEVSTPGPDKNNICFNSTGAQKAACFNVTRNEKSAEVCIWTFSESQPRTFSVPQEGQDTQSCRLTISKNKICVISKDYSFSQSIAESLTHYDKYYSTKED